MATIQSGGYCICTFVRTFEIWPSLEPFSLGFVAIVHPFDPEAAPGCSDETLPVNGTSPQARRRRGKAWEGVVYQFVTTGAPGADRKVVGGLWRLANAI